MIRVVIADDSAFMRKVLSDLFNKTPDFEVAGTAANGKEAINQVLRLKPDLLTLDVFMPVMDGLTALEIIMKDCPVPVLMFSSLTKKGADETVKALELGAVDFLCKTGGSISRIDAIEDEIIDKCRSAARANVKNLKKNKIFQEKKQEAGNLKRISILERKGYSAPKTDSVASREISKPAVSSVFKPKPSASELLKPKSSATDRLAKRDNPLLKNRMPSSVSSGGAGKIIALGTSTGGPRALQYVIPKLPADMPCGMVVVQHMPAGFTKSLADRLNSLSQVHVKEAEDHEAIKPGWVYIAPGNYHMTVKGDASRREISLNQEPPLGSHRPAVDIMFDSVVQYGRDVVSVILTGMGCDGTAGMKKIKAAGGYIIAENAETSVVYGMPKAVADAGIADEILPVHEIAAAIMKAVRK